MLTQPSTSYKPFKYPEYVQAALAHDKAFWAEHEATKVNEDLRQWQSGVLTPQEKYHITSLLQLFTQSDVVVGGSYVDVFLPRLKNNEVRMMMLSFAHRETIHQRAYALLNDTLGLPEETYSTFNDYQEMSDKIEFMQDFNPDTVEGLGLALAKTVCNEGMSLFSAFIQLLNYQRTNKMQGMCEIVEWSIRDESMHVMGMADVFQRYCRENPQIVTDSFKKKIYQMFRDAVALEDRVIDLAYANGGPSNLPKEDLKLYIRYLADRRLIQLGLKGNFKIKTNPIEWLDWVLNGDSFKNFFETTVTNYDAEPLVGSWGWPE